ncbi:MAG: ATP-binding protein [Planctomycetota bacterium]|nr:MAG: ATP-binding protein [Planctomycetota bacterium]
MTPSDSAAPQTGKTPPPATCRTVDEILATASEDGRATLKLLGELVGNEPVSVATPAQFATRQLRLDPLSLASTRYTGPSTSLSILGNLLRLELEKHGDSVVIGSPGDGLPPTWSQLDLGLDQRGESRQLTVPGRLVAHFPAGTLAAAPLCVLIDDRHWSREFAILSATADKGVAETLLASFRARMKSSDNPLRGRVLQASLNEGCIRVGVSPAIDSRREGLILPDELWREIDVFLAAATSRRELLRSLGLGTNRGLLVAGPPGVGKTHLVRVIAASLVGQYTTILADANSMRHALADLYAESDTFGPTLVVLDDIDLVLGHRDSGGDNTALADFLATLDGVRQREDVLTIATTNDPKSLDPAAQRSSRFDMIVALPMPDAVTRTRILGRHLEPLGLAIDLHAMAEHLEGATGADVREVVRRAILEHGGSFTSEQLADIALSGRWRANVNRRKYL